MKIATESVQNTINDYINTLKPNYIYITIVDLIDHVNLHYIDTYNNYVYIYEPHMPTGENQHKYCVYTISREIYNKRKYTIKDIPENILKQTNLALCFMYILHFILYTLTTFNDTISTIKYDSSDNIYIMSFVKYILKLCHEYNKIDNIEYYILTNNKFKIQELMTSNTEINNLLSISQILK